MNLHDPPVVLKENIKRGDEFDPELYVKQHDEDNTVDFVVLPTLMLKSGSIIAKGVVQCKQIKTKQLKSIFLKKSVN
ncbi:hypothetical protein DPMN_152670 [Dreissena polymorpha]|uniref:Mitochondria-eating protein C-terminal domain-containing protein n=1 Tax=Dreissena polymorpha TaxID=45954 RepID=A0A9D4FNF5_DREPO|nr:hypothetical protein DPMN_152670 [Dreissena polymorpha]